MGKGERWLGLGGRWLERGVAWLERGGMWLGWGGKWLGRGLYTKIWLIACLATVLLTKNNFSVMASLICILCGTHCYNKS